MKFVELANFGLLEYFRALHSIKVSKFVKLSNSGILEDFVCAILHKSHLIC